MTKQPNIVAFSGSLRRDSYNQRLVRLAAESARQAGAKVKQIQLTDYPLPLLNEDLERVQGMPAEASALKDLLQSHDGLLIASPEYNSSITGALKNAIDWATRRTPDEAPLVAFRGKVAAIMSASPGSLGGLRGLVHLRAILGNIGVLVLPDQVVVPHAHEAFDDDGRLNDEALQARVDRVGRQLAETVARLL